MDFQHQPTGTFLQPNINTHTHVPIDLGDDGKSQPDISYLDEMRFPGNNNNNLNNNYHSAPQNINLNHSKNQKDFSNNNRSFHNIKENNDLNYSKNLNNISEQNHEKILAILNQSLQTRLNTTSAAIQLTQLELEDPNQSPFGYCCRWMHICFVFLYAIAAVAVSGVLFNYFPENTQLRRELDLTINNWKTDVISDIQIVVLSSTNISEKSPPNCPVGYQIFLSFDLPQYFAGCDCTSSTYSSKTVLLGECSQNQLDLGCANLAAINESKGIYWVANTVSFIICAKRMTGYSYSSKGSLSTCEKQCGSTINNDNIFCVSSSDTCPINYLQIGTTADPSITSIQPITIGASGYSLFYSREGPGAPIIDLRVTKGSGVCLDNAINNLYSTSTPFVLLNQNYTTVCKEIDTRFTSISTMTEDKLFSANYFLQSSLAIQLKYGVSTTETYGLYVRGIVTLASSRRDNDVSNVLESQSLYSQVIDLSLSVLYTSSFYLFFVGLIYTTLSTLNLLGKKAAFKQFLFNMQAPQKDSNSRPTTLFSRLWLKIIFSAIQFISLLVSFIIVILRYQQLQALATGQLGDSYTIALFAGLKDEFYIDIFWYFISNCIWFLAIFIVEIIILIPLCGRKLREKQEIKVSKKYTEKHRNKLNNYNAKQDNQFGLSVVQPTIEMAEYQTHNMYAGNGINTTMGVDMNKSVLGPLFQQTKSGRFIQVDNSILPQKSIRNRSILINNSTNQNINNISLPSEYNQVLDQFQSYNVSYSAEPKPNNINSYQYDHQGIEKRASPWQTSTAAPQFDQQQQQQYIDAYAITQQLSPPPSVSVIQNPGIGHQKVQQASPDAQRVQRARQMNEKLKNNIQSNQGTNLSQANSKTSNNLKRNYESQRVARQLIGEEDKQNYFSSEQIKQSKRLSQQDVPQQRLRKRSSNQHQYFSNNDLTQNQRSKMLMSQQDQLFNANQPSNQNQIMIQDQLLMTDDQQQQYQPQTASSNSHDYSFFPQNNQFYMGRNQDEGTIDLDFNPNDLISHPQRQQSLENRPKRTIPNLNFSSQPFIQITQGNQLAGQQRQQDNQNNIMQNRFFSQIPQVLDSTSFQRQQSAPIPQEYPMERNQQSQNNLYAYNTQQIKTLPINNQRNGNIENNFNQYGMNNNISEQNQNMLPYNQINYQQELSQQSEQNERYYDKNDQEVDYGNDEDDNPNVDNEDESEITLPAYDPQFY